MGLKSPPSPPECVILLSVELLSVSKLPPPQPHTPSYPEFYLLCLLRSTSVTQERSYFGLTCSLEKLNLHPVEMDRDYPLLCSPYSEMNPVERHTGVSDQYVFSVLLHWYFFDVMSSLLHWNPVAIMVFSSVHTKHP